jgi:hypothetical protein
MGLEACWPGEAGWPGRADLGAAFRARADQREWDLGPADPPQIALFGSLTEV